MKLTTFHLLNLEVGEYEPPFMPTKLRYAISRLCKAISYCNRVKEGEDTVAAIAYDEKAGIIEVRRPLAADFSGIDDVVKWTVVCNLLANPETNQLVPFCDNSVISSVRNFFGRERITMSVYRGENGRVTFSTRKAAAKSDRIRSCMEAAIAKGVSSIPVDAKEASYIRVIVSREAGKWPDYKFSVSAEGDRAVIRASKLDQRKQRVAYLLSMITENAEDTRGVMEFDTLTADLRELLYGSVNGAAALV